MNKELEEAVNICKGITTDDLLNCWTGGEKEYNAIQTVVQASENSIPTETIKAKKQKLEKEYKERI